MATQKNKAGATAAEPVKFKKGDVTIDGVNFNDSWARALKPIDILNEDGSVKETWDPQTRFINEFKDHHYQDLAEADRIEALKKAFAACQAAE
jgi:hypothetical protein